MRVQAIVAAVDISHLAGSGEVLLALEDEQAAVHETLIAWSQVREYTSFKRVIDRELGGEPPTSGFSIVLNKPHSLILRCVWESGPAAMWEATTGYLEPEETP